MSSAGKFTSQYFDRFYGIDSLEFTIFSMEVRGRVIVFDDDPKKLTYSWHAFIIPISAYTFL